MRPKRNPYNWQQVNPDLFYGASRLDLVGTLKNGLSNGQSFGITGGRRMGKTTLLRRVEKELLRYTQDVKSGGLIVLPVYIETLSIQSSSFSPDVLYQEVMSRLSQRLSEQNITLSSNWEMYNFQSLKEYLNYVLNSVTSHRLQIAFIFDEIELVSRAPWGSMFFANWRSLLNNTPNIQEYLSAVFCGATEMFEISRDVGSPLGNILEWQELELLSLQDTSNLVCEPIQYDWSADFIEKVFTLTGGHPFIIQYLMQVVCDHEIIRATQSLEEAKHKFLRNQKFQFQNWWDKFDETTKMIYALIAEGNPIPREYILKNFGLTSEKSISILCHTGVAIYNRETKNLQGSGSLFKDWFYQYQFENLKITPNLASRLDELLKDLERKMRQFLTVHFDDKSPSWLQNHFEKNNPKKWQSILARSKNSEGSRLNNSEVLKNSDLGDLFELILLNSEWEKLYKKFCNLSSDKKQAKFRFEERKDHLVSIRNKLRHVREDEIEPTAFLKAQAFCMELLESLSLSSECTSSS